MSSFAGRRPGGPREFEQKLDTLKLPPSSERLEPISTFLREMHHDLEQQIAALADENSKRSVEDRVTSLIKVLEGWQTKLTAQSELFENTESAKKAFNEIQSLFQENLDFLKSDKQSLESKFQYGEGSRAVLLNTLESLREIIEARN